MAFDTKKFIKEVEKRGVLWKAPTLGQAGKIQELKLKAWEEIGEIMFSNWEGSNQSTREARVREMKLLWRNIENKFYRDFKNGLLEGRKGKKYKEILSFLLLAGGDRQGELSKVKEKSDRYRHEKLPVKEAKKILKTPKKPEKAIELLPVMSPSRELKDAKDVEEDASFFKSMLPSLKKFNDQQRLDFRLEVLQVLKKVKDDLKNQKTVIPNGLVNKPR